MNDKSIGKIFASEDQLKDRIIEIGTLISKDYHDKHPVLISVLKGALYFLADLTRQITIPINLDFLAIGVYSGITNHTGIVRITKDLDMSITDRHVILVEDIIGTGLTLSYIYQHLESLKPASLKICALIDIPSKRLVSLPISYKGFDAPDDFLIGYGLDHNEEYRHLPYIAHFTDAK